ncbi:MAG: sugar phosphate isomerase/epimerase family protein [Syntrophorhabdales bacterium]|jgi:sugar phosphate isomerase/epimerase
MPAPNRKLLINAPYDMVRPGMDRMLSLQVGVEVYLSNEAVNEIDRQDARQLGRELEDRGIICTVHAPFIDLSPGGVDKEIRHISLEKLKKSSEAARLLGAQGMVCHGGYDRWRFDGHEGLWLRNSMDTWTELLKESGDMPLMIENVFEETPSTIVALLDRFAEKNLWFCFDTGHFNLFTTLSLGDWLMPLRDRLREFHIHDNHGKSDEHLPVGRGIFPFRELKRLMKGLDAPLFTAEIPDESAAFDAIKAAKEFLS